MVFRPERSRAIARRRPQRPSVFVEYAGPVTETRLDGHLEHWHADGECCHLMVGMGARCISVIAELFTDRGVGTLVKRE